MKQSLVRALSVIFAAALVCAACSSSSKSSSSSSAASGSSSSSAGAATSSSQPFHLAMVVGVTGALAGPTKGMIIGVKAAAAVLNKSGGINGRQVVVDVLNDESDPTTAVSVLAARLASGPRPDAVWAGSSGSDSLSLVPILTRDKLIGIGQAGADELNNPKLYPYYFSTAPTATSYSTSAANAMLAHGYKRVAIIATSDATGQSVATDFQKAFTAGGGVISGTQLFDPTALDVRAQLESLKATNPDALFIRGYGAPAGHVIDGLSAIAWNIPSYGDVAVGASNLPSLVTPNELTNVEIQLNNVDVQQPTPSAAYTTFYNAVSSLTTVDQAVDAYSFGYDALMQLANACKVAQSTDTVKVSQTLETTTYVGVTATYKYSATSHFPLPSNAFTFVPATAKVVNGQYAAS
jgi:branched-chain amino acid transport system substrate-binding protein